MADTSSGNTLEQVRNTGRQINFSSGDQITTLLLNVINVKILLELLVWLMDESCKMFSFKHFNTVKHENMRVLNLPALFVEVKQNLLSKPEATNEEFLNVQ